MTDKSGDLWRVYDFCDKEYCRAMQEAGIALNAGDYEAFVVCDGKAEAFREVQNLIADIFHQSEP